MDFRKINKMKEELLHLLIFGAVSCLFQPLVSYGAFEDRKYEELRLVNPDETLKDVTVRKTSGYLTIIFHSEGVMNVKPDRFSGEMLEELDYDLDEWAEFEKKFAETSKRMRLEYERKMAEEEEKRKLEAKQKAEAEKLLVKNLDKKIKEAYEKQFSDDRHPYAERIIATSLKDPHSYRFIQSEASLVYLQRYASRYERYRVPAVKVLVKYSGTNSYGGRIADTEELYFSISGDYIRSSPYNLNMEIIEKTEATLGVSRDLIDKYVEQIEEKQKE